MAKVRRRIRKVNRQQSYFDDQLWPINLALFVLGGFLLGASIAYQGFDDPRWYANAWLSVILVPLLVGGTMIALRYVTSRMVRRGMQLAVVLSLTAHLMMIIASVELDIFGRTVANVTRPRQLVERRVPDFNPFRQREQQDHERPVETPVPETLDDAPVEREEAEETQAQPQPTPVPEPQPNATPSVTQRQSVETPTPRRSDAPSQVARSHASATPAISRAAPSPNSARSASPQTSLQAAAAQVQRRSTSNERAARLSQTDPTQQAPSAAAPARRQLADSQPQDQSAPTLPRRLATPSRTPVADATASQPNQAQQTTTDPLQAAPTETARRETTSPNVQRTPVEPTPVSPDQPSREVQRREQPSPERPQMAASPESSPTRQSRVTSRPETRTLAQVAAPSPSQNNVSPLPAQPAPTSVTRANTSVDAARAALVEPSTPAPQAAPSSVARRQSQPDTIPSPDVSPTQLTRRTSPAQRPTAAPEAASPAAVAQSSSPVAPVSPASTATRRQPTRQLEVARATGEPSSASSSNPSAAASPSRNPSRSRSQDAPLVADSPGAVSRQRTSQLTVEFASADSTSPLSSSPASPSQQGIRPAMSEVSRQPTNSPAASDSNRPAQAALAASSTNQVAQASTARSSPADAPSLQPAVAPTTPARARLSGALASPSPADNPAVAQNTRSDGQQPSMQAAPTALTRATAGTAGIGRSANLDRNEPAGESLAMMASASARRQQATRADEPSALNDSQPSLVARNRADQQRPSTVFEAQDVEVATAAGSDLPSEISATSSASLTRAASDSQQGAVNASRGESEVDIGPTRLVSNSGADRAAGGGQPELNFESQSHQVTRDSRGGEVTMSIAADDTAEAPTAPEAEGGGEPQVQAPESALVAQRQDAGGAAPASGGPSRAEPGPSAEPNAADTIAAMQVARADGAAAELDFGGASGGSQAEQDEEDEEERARRLAAQRAGGGPEVAIAGAQIEDVPASDASPDPLPAGRSVPAAPAADVTRSQVAAGGTPSPAGPEPGDTAAPNDAPQGGAQLAANVRVRRAEAVEAMAGSPAVGGGSSSPRRADTGPQFNAAIEAPEVAMAGQPNSTGAPDSSPLAAQGLQVGRMASGARAPARDGPLGALASASPPAAGAGAAPGGASASRSQSAADAPGPVADDGPAAGGPRRTYSRVGAPAVAEADSPSDIDFPAAPNQSDDMAEFANAAAQVGQLARAAADASLEAEIDSVEGPSGLAGIEAGSPGINSRRAQAESIDMTTRSAKFLRRSSGGLPDFNISPIAATQPFRRREQRTGDGATGSSRSRPGPQTERAIEAGLVFLSRHQLPDGSWSLKGINNEPVLFSSDAAATGLCLLAFQGAGYSHREHKYAEVVRSGLDFLLKNQNEDGSLFVPADSNSNKYVKLYTHGIAAIALCEAYGMTQDPALKEPAQKALEYVVNTQHETLGGWRYTPGKDSDTSVTGWMMMALKSGELAGLEVPKDSYTRMKLWLDRAQAPGNRHLYVYNPSPGNRPERQLGKVASKSMSSVGLLAQLYLGWKRDNPNMIRGANYLMRPENLPQMGFNEENPLEKKRDTYYWYYGTQVMFHMGGDYWKKWNGALHPLLIDTQLKSGDLAGSWDPYAPVPDRWGTRVGRLYVTTMNLLSLEVYYRHLPLYEDTAK